MSFSHLIWWQPSPLTQRFPAVMIIPTIARPERALASCHPERTAFPSSDGWPLSPTHLASFSSSPALWPVTTVASQFRTDFSGSRAWATPLLFSVLPLSNITPILGDDDSTAAAVNSRGSSTVTMASHHPLPPWLSDVSGIETAVVFSSAGLGTSHLAADIAVAMKGHHFFSGTS